MNSGKLKYLSRFDFIYYRKKARHAAE